MTATSPADIRTTPWLRLAATVGCVYIIPVVLLASGMIDAKWRFHVLLAMSLVALGLTFARHQRIVGLGGSLPRVSEFVRWSILPSALVLALLFVTRFVVTGNASRFVISGKLPFFVFFAFVSAPAQEFLFRSFLFAELTYAKIPTGLTILFSSLLFAFMHIIYRDALTLTLTFIAGLLWGVLFTRTRNLCIVAVSHAILGVGGIALGVI